MHKNIEATVIAIECLINSSIFITAYFNT